jgi:hypothetical protein
MLLNAGQLFEEVCRLCREAVLPVFGSSANLSGTGPRFRVEDIQPELRAIADVTVDYGLRRCHIYQRSATILRFGNGDVECVRIGSYYELISDEAPFQYQSARRSRSGNQRLGPPPGIRIQTRCLTTGTRKNL